MYTVCDQSAHSHLPVARDQLHPGSALNSAFFGQFGRNLYKCVGCLLPNPFCAVGKVPLMEVFQKPSVV